MELKDAFKQVALVGAAGKMGRGIALLLLQELAVNWTADHKLILIDSHEAGLQELRRYLEQHLIKYAEKQIISLRKIYGQNQTLVSNQDIIAAFIGEAFDRVSFQTDAASARHAAVVFEAVVESADVKAELFREMKGEGKQFFFTNTSSIPIHVLREKSGLKGSLVGVHFYNPPPVQQLLELIAPKDTLPEAKQLALDLAKTLGKVVVESADVAGFIGNGHFIREVVFATRTVAELSKRLPLEESIYLINRVTGDFLVRPMGMFQLIDFVGIDVVQQILATMRHYLNDESLHSKLIDQMVEGGRVGGLSETGTMREGFFQYANNKPVASPWAENVKQALGPLPAGYLSWKELHQDPECQKKVEQYFEKLFESGTPGSEVAIDFLLSSKEIALMLVRDGIAPSMEAVNTVLKKGFYHLYDANIPWFNFAAVFRNNL